MRQQQRLKRQDDPGANSGHPWPEQNRRQADSRGMGARSRDRRHLQRRQYEYEGGHQAQQQFAFRVVLQQSVDLANPQEEKRRHGDKPNQRVLRRQEPFHDMHGLRQIGQRQGGYRNRQAGNCLHESS